jgi:hypothetical protein
LKENKYFVVPKCFDETEDKSNEEDVYGNTDEMTLMQRLENVREFKQWEDSIVKNMDKEMVKNKKELKKETLIENTFKRKKRKREEKSMTKEKGKKMIRLSADDKHENNDTEKIKKRPYFDDEVIERLRDQNKKRRVVLNVKLMKELKNKI